MGDSSLHAFSLSVLKVIMLSQSLEPNTLQLHYNAVVGVHGKMRYNGPRYIHATVVQIDQNR